MVIKSYLVFPLQGQKNELQKQIEHLKWCEVVAAENKELLVIVAETESDEDEKNFLEELNNLKGLQHYSLVSGFNEK
ncbi:MAG: chaperone NapD [Cyclobacteriaceae bacterium]|nr:chaperone NapD [Cyclobacteriaceae bacterium]